VLCLYQLSFVLVSFCSCGLQVQDGHTHLENVEY